MTGRERVQTRQAGEQRIARAVEDLNVDIVVATGGYRVEHGHRGAVAVHCHIVNRGAGVLIAAEKRTVCRVALIER